MFVIDIKEADFIGAKSADGKDNPDYSEKEVRALVKAEVYGNNAYQHELLNFIFNAKSSSHSVSTAILPNGHEGLQIRFRASADEYKEFLASKEERALQEKADRGDADAQRALVSLRAKKEEDAKAAADSQQGQSAAPVSTPAASENSSDKKDKDSASSPSAPAAPAKVN